MSTSTAENSTQTSENTASKFDLTKLDETDSLMHAKTEKAITDYNSTITTLKSLSGDLAEVTDSVRDSDDPEIVSLREKVEKAQATLTKAQENLDNSATEKAKARIAENTDEAKVKELTEKSEKLLKRIRGTQAALKVDYGDEIMTSFTALVNRKSSGGGTGKGAGVARPRNFTVTVNGEVALLPNAKGDKVSSFSAAAKVIGCSTQVVQEGYFSSEGTNAEGWTPGKTVAFDVTHDGKTYKVEATKNRDA